MRLMNKKGSNLAWAIKEVFLEEVTVNLRPKMYAELK